MSVLCKTYLPKTGDHNLIKLSSIIPPDSSVEVGDFEGEGKFGDKLYVVLSKRVEEESGKEAWAGLGWSQDESGKGVFFEASGFSEGEVENIIEQSIASSKEYRKNLGEVKMKKSEVKCNEDPVCAVVAAVYRAEDWGEKD